MAETQAEQTLEEARRKRDSDLAQARQETLSLQVQAEKEGKAAAAEKVALARKEIEAEKDQIVKEGRKELKKLHKASQDRIGTAADRFVELFVEAPDA